jgi:iron-sulfur cluster repair protein YtfE (RIC family)
MPINRMAQSSDLDLSRRAVLPAEFQLILGDYPRHSWPDHRDFNGLAAFWLDRHLGFRQTMTTLNAEAEALLDRTLDPAAWKRRLSQRGSALLGDLMGHHQIEDHTYFPELTRLEPRLSRGFDMLDADHHALHALIDRFAKGANAALSSEGAALLSAASTFRQDLTRFQTLLARHLTDEEDLVLPVVLKHRVG